MRLNLKSRLLSGFFVGYKKIDLILQLVKSRHAMKFSAIVLAILSYGGLSAQDYTFKVLINKGQNEIKSGNDWIAIKVGESLQSTDELRISQNGYLGLVHVSGKPLEVKKAGVHKVADLAGSLTPGSSVLHKYTDFILSSKTENNSSLTATGAVYRGDFDIKVYLPKSQNVVYSDDVIIAWAKDAKAKKYIVKFNSMFGDELEKREVADTTFSLKLDGARLLKEDNILVEVSDAGDARRVSETFVLKKLSSADKKRINTSLREIAAQMKEATALNQLLLAAFYEQNSLLIDASTALQQAIRLAPNIPDFQEAYRDFLVRNALVDPKK